ncbi:EF hand [Sphingomonas sp. OV641]|uniref:EF-hand domain-containing protein n=1 Tax=Sphingomonas sp. OV641 TaxID=1881068 RepID=UPI0008CCAE89|nr:EF-hand domain-containing protein [Sphingomonas sp. OV641]SEJ06209.1 EF hand [Sphingomonas sp. OV641]
MKRLLIAAALSATTLAGVAVAQNPAPSAAMAKRGPAAADTNGDGIVTRTEASAAADALFARFDANRDGKISADERRGRRGADAPDMTQQQFRERAMKRFDLADANKDGRIDQAERQNMRGKRGDHRRGGIMHHGGGKGGMGMMMRADANRDGILTKAEATAAAAAMFDRADTNKDGRIDQAEQEAARAQMKNRMGARPNPAAVK